jgi:hypothetical protein
MHVHAALLSTTASLSPFSSTVTSPVPATATTENTAPSGFQHLVQPQAWLCAIWPFTATFTGLLVHAQTKVPPAKLALSFGRPLSMLGCNFSAMSSSLVVLFAYRTPLA